MKKVISNHPNPQFERDNWQSLNGPWSCGFKKRKAGYNFSVDGKLAEEMYKTVAYDHIINVPFCVESELSGIGYKDFMNQVWYHRIVDIKAGDHRVMLHIGAADYLTSVVVNGKCAGRHKGGYTSFCFDITEYVKAGENSIFILCEDDTKNPLVCGGKQSNRKESYACSYTRTTGIWQNVYIEYVPQSYIKNFKLYPDYDNGCVMVSADVVGCGELTATACYDGKEVGSAAAVANGNTNLMIKLDEIHPWTVGQGDLYDLELCFGEDKVKSYFGLRTLKLDGYKFLINGKSVFQRLVLDQGFYKKGIYTAQDDEELVQDIKLSLAVGFNGARLHQKVFDPRFLYYCDMMGYIVWGEYANWGLDYSSAKAVDVFLNEWSEAIQRDFNHPAIVGWCPFNETWDYHRRRQYDPLLATVYDYTKAVDPTRPCIDTSGNYHVKTDIYDVHDYNYDVDFFKKNYDRLVTEGYLYEHVLVDNPGRQQYNGEPTFVSEYGGIKWEGDSAIKSWGYGKDVKSPQELADRYCGLTDALIHNKCMLGLCYTQLYDVEQEQNGLYTYDRKPKFDADIYAQIKACNTQVADIEK